MKIKLSAPSAMLLLSVYLLCVFNVGYWQEVSHEVLPTAKGIIFMVMMFIALCAAIFVVLNLFFLPYLHKFWG